MNVSVRMAVLYLTIMEAMTLTLLIKGGRVINPAMQQDETRYPH